ncbi:MAG: polysaccharide deacetylase family protein [Deltaproteobacteria bacterium]|nr:polysaccharide deacetylase family protein [Deltaproteobacteria bacterium]
MKMKAKTIVWSSAHIAGIIFIIAGCAAFFIHPCLTIVLFLLYIIMCVGACFFPGTNFLGEVVSRGCTGRNDVALTFDDGPSGFTTPKILDLLDRHQAKAAFFVSGVNALRHPDLIREIIRRGHTIGNHSMNHDPLIMLKGQQALEREVREADRVLRSMGVFAKAFRPPVGIINPQLPPVLAELGLVCVVFSRRARDAGNRRVRNLASKILKNVRGDDIILLHDIPPGRPEDDAIFWRELELLLTGLAERGLQIVPLSRLTGEQLMSVDSGKETSGAEH